MYNTNCCKRLGRHKNLIKAYFSGLPGSLEKNFSYLSLTSI